MHPEHLMTQRCTLKVRLLDDETEERDEFGNPEAEEVEVPDVPCFMSQTQNVALRGESAGLAQVQEESFKLLLPARITRTVDEDEVEVEPDGIDGVEVEGVPFEMYGPPWPVYNPRLRKVTHVEATIRRSA